MPASAMLLVTWFVVGQRPESYQVRVANCEAARAALLHDAERLRGEMPIHPLPPGFVINTPNDKAPKTIPASEYPKVSAVCADADAIVDWRTYFNK
jgi:hypothetical protein